MLQLFAGDTVDVRIVTHEAVEFFDDLSVVDVVVAGGNAGQILQLDDVRQFRGHVVHYRQLLLLSHSSQSITRVLMML